jgi:RNA polymerase sigma-70 factor, ECF subfamily
MTGEQSMPEAPAIEDVFREHHGRVLASLISYCGDFQLAEDALQEAYLSALSAWREGVPRNPAGWLATTARHRAIDTLRRRQTLQRKQDELGHRLELDAAAPAETGTSTGALEDDRLRLIFTCCHPAIAREGQIALTLRTLCGLTTAEIARAFLTSETTMAQRLVRVKRKIRTAGIPYKVPDAKSLPERLDSVLAVVYLVFNEGYLSTSGEELARQQLSEEAIRLGRLLAELLPDEPEVKGLLSLMLLQDSRRQARTNARGELVLLEDQDRRLWDQSRIREGLVLVAEGQRLDRPGPYQLQAAIAAAHAQALRADETDWTAISGLYGQLLELRPSPVIELNRAVAVAMAEGPEAGLRLLRPLDQTLDGYYLYHSAVADLSRRSGRWAAAEDAYRRALKLTSNAAERRFLRRRLDEVSGRSEG